MTRRDDDAVAVLLEAVRPIGLIRAYRDHVLTFAIPPESPIDPLGAGSYTAPAIWDDAEWASPTPCHLKWVIRKVAELEVEGRLDVRCPVCDRPWEVLWIHGGPSVGPRSGSNSRSRQGCAMVRWQDRAVCAGMGSGLFLPIGVMGSALEQAEQAKAVCARCPVITQCLD